MLPIFKKLQPEPPTKKERENPRRNLPRSYKARFKMIKNHTITVNEYIVNKKLLHYIGVFWQEEKKEELLNSLNYKEKQELLRELDYSAIEELANRLVELKKELERRLQNV